MSRRRVLDEGHFLLPFNDGAGGAPAASAVFAVGAKFGQQGEQLIAVKAAVELRPRVRPHVAVELLQALEDVLADVARVRQRRLHSPVPLQDLAASRGPARVVFGVAVMTEGLPTASAVVALHRPVRELVHTQEIGLAERFSTHVALVGLLSGVDPDMPYEGGRETEGFAAVLAHFPLLHIRGRRAAFRAAGRAGLFALALLLLRHVQLHVRGVLGTGDAEVAHRACLLDVALPVRLQVKVEVGVFAKTFATLRAFKWPLSSVNALMDEELGHEFNNLATETALQYRFPSFLGVDGVQLCLCGVPGADIAGVWVLPSI